MESSKLLIGSLVVGPVSTNSYIVREGEAGKELLLIDPGDEPGRFLAIFEELHARPEIILLTHGHYDHIMAVNEIKEAYPSCRVMIAEAERPMVENSELNCNFFPGEYSIEPDRYLKDGDEIEVFGRSFRVIGSPGHTAGSVCYYSEEDGVLFSGDTIFLNGYGRVDLPTGDRDRLFASLEKVLGSLPEETVVLPGHGDATTVGHEYKMNGYLF